MKTELHRAVDAFLNRRSGILADVAWDEIAAGCGGYDYLPADRKRLYRYAHKHHLITADTFGPSLPKTLLEGFNQFGIEFLVVLESKDRLMPLSLIHI